METKAIWPAKIPTASFVAQRKQKAFGNTNSSSNLRPQSFSQCPPPPMNPQQIEFLIGRPNHISVVKVFVLLSVVVLLFLNIISSLFNYPFAPPPILNFSAFSFYSSSNYSSPPRPNVDSYSHPNLNTSLPPSKLEFSSSHPPNILNSATPLNSPPPPPPPPLNAHPPLRQPSSDLVSSSSSSSQPPQPFSHLISSFSSSQPRQPSDLISSASSPPPQPSSNMPLSPPTSPSSLNPPIHHHPSSSLNPPSSPSSLNLPPPLPPPSLDHPRLVLPTNLNSLSPPPPPSQANLSSSHLKSSKSSRKVVIDCDLSRGEWVRDWQAPYYTNMTCYTIQEHQNCMKYGRPNMDFLKWRWKPDHCELPLFDPNQFLELMRGKTLAFVGDSLARNQMQSLMCLLSQVVYPEDISETSDDNFKRMYYSAFNFTISIFWSPFLIRAKQTRGPDRMILWNFYLDEVDEKWASHIDEFHYVVISGGNWFNRPSIFYQKRRIVGCLYCPSKKVTHRTMHYSHRRAFHTAFAAINKSTKFKGTVILRTVSPSHFENGIWDKGGDCVRTTPFGRNETNLSSDDLQLYKDQLTEFQTAKTEGRKKGIDFMLLDTTNAMLQRPDGHPSRYGHWPQQKVTLYNDCVHWCLPGPVDMWNDVLLQMLCLRKKLSLGANVHSTF